MPKYIPYRGDGFSKDFEPRKKFVNLRKLRGSLTKTISGIIVVFGTITFFVLRTLSQSSGVDKASYIAALVLIWMFPLVFIAGILDFNKFRRGRDVDISDQEEKKDENSSDES